MIIGCRRVPVKTMTRKGVFETFVHVTYMREIHDTLESVEIWEHWMSPTEQAKALDIFDRTQVYAMATAQVMKSLQIQAEKYPDTVRAWSEVVYG